MNEDGKGRPKGLGNPTRAIGPIPACDEKANGNGYRIGQGRNIQSPRCEVAAHKTPRRPSV